MVKDKYNHPPGTVIKTIAKDAAMSQVTPFVPKQVELD